MHHSSWRVAFPPPFNHIRGRHHCFPFLSARAARRNIYGNAGFPGEDCRHAAFTFLTVNAGKEIPHFGLKTSKSQAAIGNPSFRPTSTSPSSWYLPLVSGQKSEMHFPVIPASRNAVCLVPIRASAHAQPSSQPRTCVKTIPDRFPFTTCPQTGSRSGQCPTCPCPITAVGIIFHNNSKKSCNFPACPVHPVPGIIIQPGTGWYTGKYPDRRQTGKQFLVSLPYFPVPYFTALFSVTCLWNGRFDQIFIQHVRVFPAGTAFRPQFHYIIQLCPGAASRAAHPSFSAEKYRLADFRSPASMPSATPPCRIYPRSPPLSTCSPQVFSSGPTSPRKTRTVHSTCAGIPALPVMARLFARRDHLPHAPSTPRWWEPRSPAFSSRTRMPCPFPHPACGGAACEHKQ